MDRVDHLRDRSHVEALHLMTNDSGQTDPQARLRAASKVDARTQWNSSTELWMLTSTYRRSADENSVSGRASRELREAKSKACVGST